VGKLKESAGSERPPKNYQDEGEIEFSLKVPLQPEEHPPPKSMLLNMHSLQP
jgi:hypothetical protein